MKLIMESWKRFLKEDQDSPADGMKPVNPKVYDVHLGGADHDATHSLLIAANDALYKIEAYLYELDEDNSEEDLRALNQLRYPQSGPNFGDLERKMRTIKSLLAD